MTHTLHRAIPALIAAVAFLTGHPVIGVLAVICIAYPPYAVTRE